MKRAISALLCAAALAAPISVAEARPHRHHRHHHLHQAFAVQEEQPILFGGIQSGLQQGFSAGTGFVERARQFVGETAHQVGVRSALWCSAFLRKITGATGVDDRALSWESHRHIAPQVGAVVTMGRRGGGHVGIVSGFTAKGDPIVISGNHGHRVAESVYPRHRIRAWVSPT
ncbi:TIGR02594 family protein [Bradyrhizobium sp. HKCCYLS20291]|uniref:TIGR02594 family protein n=1 Tax=Bradyrhizobium sp. HKCCYLS20291 TaxID=3420766 RepID=UPI003EBB11C7